jgi:hypothetical protein
MPTSTLRSILDKIGFRFSRPRQPNVAQSVAEADKDESTRPSPSLDQIKTDPLPEIRELLNEYTRIICTELYIVHSLPKVGGKTIAATLIANFGFAYVGHAHCLTEIGSRIWSAALPRYRRLLREEAIQHLYHARKAAMFLEAGTALFPKTQKRAIICGVREPISWALSLYFEAFSGLYSDDYDGISVETVAGFVREVLANERADLGLPFQSPESWLRTEFFRAHKFDIFAQDFDIEKGYQVYESEVTPILIIRQENLSSLSAALSSLLGYPAELIEPVNANEAGSKSYAGIYESIKKALKFDREWLRSVYASAYSRKFYSEGECEFFTERWAR